VQRLTRRRISNGIALALAVLATAIGLFFLIWLLWTLLAEGLPWIGPKIFTEITPPPGSAGGLSNAILGSLLLTLVGVLIGAPAGLLAGTWLSELGSGTWLAATVRFVNDVLLSAPSIIIGVFVYTLLVHPVGHFSGWAGAVALALIVLPVVVRTTDDMLRLVPDSLREAGMALGAPRWKVIVMVVYRAARGGLMTGVLLSVARIAGETAPLLFTALNNQFWSTNMGRPIANLPVVIFQFAMSPYEDWHHLAWAGALLITFTILALNIVVRTVLRVPKYGY